MTEKISHIEFDGDFWKSFKRLDKPIQKQIMLWLEKNVNGRENPRWTGKGLTANKSGLWRYRVGKYKVIGEIQDEHLLVLVINAGKRATIYD